MDIKPKIEPRELNEDLINSVDNNNNKRKQRRRKRKANNNDSVQQNQGKENQYSGKTKLKRHKKRERRLEMVNQQQISKAVPPVSKVGQLRELARLQRENAMLKEQFKANNVKMRKEQIVTRADWNKWKAKKDKARAKRQKKKELKKEDLKKIQESKTNNVANGSALIPTKTKKQKRRENIQNLTEQRLKLLRNSITNLLKYRNHFKNDETQMIKDGEYQHICSTIANIIPILLQPKKFNRLAIIRMDCNILNQLIVQAARLEPKLFAKASIFDFNSIEEDENEKKNLRLQVRILWALGASVCIFSYVSINKRSKDECMLEVEELCSMAKDLNDNPNKFDCSALVDLLISWQMSFNSKYKILPNLAMFVFAMRLNGNNFKQIMEALCNINTKLSDEEDELVEDEELEEEKDAKEIKKENRQEIKSEIIELDDDEEENEDESIEEEENNSEDDEVDHDDVEDVVNTVVNPQVLKNARKALGDACFEEGEESDHSEEDWDLNDERLFELDDALVKVFNKYHSTTTKQNNQKLIEFKKRLIDMLNICFNIAKIDIALPAWLSFITMLCESKELNQDLADCMSKIEKPLIRRKKEFKFNNKQLATFLYASIVPFQKNEEDVKLYSRHNLNLVFGAIRVLVSISSNFASKKFPQEIYKFINDLRSMCDNIDDDNYFDKDKEFLRKLLFQLFNNFTEYFNDWFELLCNDAINNEFNFTKRLNALHLLSYLFNLPILLKNQNSVLQICLNFVKFFGTKNSNNELEDVVDEPKKKKIKKELNEETSNNDNNKLENNNKIKIIYLAKLAHLFGKIVEIIEDLDNKTLILNKLINNVGIEKLDKSIENTIGIEGIKMLQRRIAYNDICWKNDNNTKLQPLKYSLNIYWQKYLERIMNLLKKSVLKL